MKAQLSQDYNVDSRHRGMVRASDNEAGKRFLGRYIKKKEEAEATSVTEDRKEDDRFVVSGPGDSNYRFRNAFGAPRSPSQRRLERVNQ